LTRNVYVHECIMIFPLIAIQSKSIEMAKSQCSYIFVDDDEKKIVNSKFRLMNFFLASVFCTKKYFCKPIIMFLFWHSRMFNLVPTTCHGSELINILKRAINWGLRMLVNFFCTSVKPLWRAFRKFLMNSILLCCIDSMKSLMLEILFQFRLKAS
jgi:hypothetical protein